MHVKKLSKKQAALIICGFSALCVAGVAGWFFLNQKDSTPVVRPRPTMAKKTPAAEGTPIGIRQKKTEEKKDAPALAMPSAPAVSDTTLGALTRLRHQTSTPAGSGNCRSAQAACRSATTCRRNAYSAFHQAAAPGRAWREETQTPFRAGRGLRPGR